MAGHQSDEANASVGGDDRLTVQTTRSSQAAALTSGGRIVNLHDLEE